MLTAKDKLTWHTARRSWPCACGCDCSRVTAYGDTYARFDRRTYCRLCARRCLIGIGSDRG